MRDRPPHRELRPLLFSNSGWVLLRSTELIMKSCETGPTVYCPYLRRPEGLIICRCHYKGSNFIYRNDLCSGSVPGASIVIKVAQDIVQRWKGYLRAAISLLYGFGAVSV